MLSERSSLLSALVEVLPIEVFDVQVTPNYGLFRAQLQRLSISLSLIDLLIVAYALVLERTLVNPE